MRDHERIDQILEKISIVWKTQPDARLMQLLLNRLPNQYRLENKEHLGAYDSSIYFVEDDKLESFLEKHGDKD
jgi:uncharacterized protein YihD (DUF1040 family)